MESSQELLVAWTKVVAVGMERSKCLKSDPRCLDPSASSFPLHHTAWPEFAIEFRLIEMLLEL